MPWFIDVLKSYHASEYARNDHSLFEMIAAGGVRDHVQKRRRMHVKKLRVLIVDDSSVMRKIVERSLHQAGLELVEVLQAGNGVEALVEVQKGNLDLILSDINMPAMDGIEFLRNLQGLEAAKGVPVVMITTEGSEARVVEALSVGAKGYIRKPFTPEQVKERVSALFGDN
jgi:two-component system chemotaxis response regulator CheY